MGSDTEAKTGLMKAVEKVGGEAGWPCKATYNSSQTGNGPSWKMTTGAKNNSDEPGCGTMAVRAPFQASIGRILRYLR